LAVVSGLRQNSTLQIVRFTDCCGVTDAQVSQIAEALLSNPSLRELKLDGTEQFGVQGIKALANLVSKNRKLETLGLLSKNGILASPIHPLVKSLKGHPCLKYLDLSYTGLSDADLGNLVEVLSTCSRLEKLDLSWNKLTHNGLELLASQPLPSALRRLSLRGNNFDEKKMPRLILRLLQDNPQLCSIVGWDVGAEEVLGGEIKHFMDLNESGRNLLGKDQSSVPLSLWPLVLERANGLFAVGNDVAQPEQDARRANAVFHLLQGPALMQRTGGGVHKASPAVIDPQERPPNK
jgi:hypothetical protein